MTTPDLSYDETRAALERVSRWIGQYLEAPDRFPVLSQVSPGSIGRQLPAAPPDDAESINAILDDFERILLPGVTHWNHPGFFAYFANSAPAAGVIGEMLAAALNVNGMLWKTSPAATELEERALDWLRQMMGLEPGWFGVIADTASTSTLLALAAAREAHPDLEIRQRGLAGRPELPVLRMYVSEQANLSVDKAIITLGIGYENCVHVPVDRAYRMRADALGELMAADRAAGRRPLAVVATAGTTGTASVDPIPEIAELCRREQVWLHVDAAYAGSAAVIPEYRDVLAGVEGADSLVVNPHKWLFTPMDLSALYTRRPEVLKRAFSLVPEYVTTSRRDEVVNFMDYGVALGRRFRALKLWMVIRAFGVNGIVDRLRAHVAMAQEFASWVEIDTDWVIAAPQMFSLVCFRYTPGGVEPAEADAMNQRILERVNASGRAYLSHTRLHDRFVLRLAIGNLRTERRHVADAWQLLKEAAQEEVRGESR
ncbi:MAG TPA: pyridoxal-dependent decarboxylase [Gemmatimonadaceae bacterium]